MYVPQKPTTMRRVFHEGSFVCSSFVRALGNVRPEVDADKPDKKTATDWRPSTNTIPATWASESDAIVISITDANRSDMSVPVRTSDVIMVPARGQVLVQRWVPNPGAYPISPDMTALGSVTAAGGELYSSSAVVLRPSSGGEKLKLPVNLSKVEKGLAPDIQVQSDDVVIVERSAVGAVPYSLYFLLSKFGTGMFLPIPTL
jgi:hypothetical protein